MNAVETGTAVPRGARAFLYTLHRPETAQGATTSPSASAAPPPPPHAFSCALAQPRCSARTRKTRGVRPACRRKLTIGLPWCWQHQGGAGRCLAVRASSNPLHGQGVFAEFPLHVRRAFGNRLPPVYQCDDVVGIYEGQDLGADESGEGGGALEDDQYHSDPFRRLFERAHMT